MCKIFSCVFELVKLRVSFPSPPIRSPFSCVEVAIDKLSFPLPKLTSPLIIEFPRIDIVLLSLSPTITAILFFNPPPLKVVFVACKLFSPFKYTAVSYPLIILSSILIFLSTTRAPVLTPAPFIIKLSYFFNSDDNM